MNTSKGLTEKQLQRRENILGAARKLIAERGYEGVTMRELAKESGVAPKTLYHQFGNKEQLLRAAVEERFRYLYRLIDEEEIEHGIDRLYHILDAVSETTQQNLAYARALTPVLTDRTAGTFTQIRMNTYRKAIDQIADEGEFVDWVNLEMLSAVIYRQVNPIYMAATRERAPWRSFAKLDISLIVAAVTTGYSRKRALQTARETQAVLTKRDASDDVS